MRNLLIIWSELEPETCITDSNNAYLFGRMAIALDQIEREDYFLLQGYLQERITAKKWDWKVENVEQLNKFYSVIDTRSADPKGGNLYKSRVSASPCESLIRAYLEVLKHQPEQTEK